MNDLFASLYESVIYDPEFDLIFETLFTQGSYAKFGLVLILIPLISGLIFYLIWKYPYAKIWHWTIWLVLVSIITGITSAVMASNEIFLSNNEALNNALMDPNSGYEEFANTLPIQYALINGILSLILGFVYSLILKQFSKIQMHLPF